MAFPAVASFSISSDTDFSGPPFSFTVTMPSGIVADDLLIGVFCLNDNFAATWPAGWTEFFERTPGVNNGDLSFAWRKATGGEGNIEVTTTNVGRSVAIVYRITGAEDPDTQAPQGGGGADGNSKTPNPGNLTPTGGAKDYLWIAAAAYGSANNPYTAPSSFTDLHQLTNSTFRGSAAQRELNAASLNPGSFTGPDNAAWAAGVLAVHPAPPPPPPAGVPPSLQHYYFG